MTYEEAVSLLSGLDFLTSYDINYGKEFHFSSCGTFAVKIMKTFSNESYAACYCISHYGGEFSFEEFYDRMPKGMQERVIFNIDVFNKVNGGQCSLDIRQALIDWSEIMTEEYNKEFDSL